MAQKAIGEASGRGANIEAGLAGNVDGEIPERAFELQTAAARIFCRGSIDFDLRIGLEPAFQPFRFANCSRALRPPGSSLALSRARSAKPLSTTSRSRRFFRASVWMAQQQVKRNQRLVSKFIAALIL